MRLLRQKFFLCFCLDSHSWPRNFSKLSILQDSRREYLRDVSVRHPDMKAPKVHDSLSWGRRKGQKLRSEDAALISNALSNLNKFSDDGNFMNEFMNHHKRPEGGSDDVINSKTDAIREAESDSAIKISEEKQPLSANQLAAKAMQLRLKGKHEEAEKLLVRFSLLYVLPYQMVFPLLKTEQ